MSGPSWGFSYLSPASLANIYKQKSHDCSWLCDPCRIQTCNPHIRSVVLYSVELTDHASFRKRVQRYCFFLIWPNNLRKKCHFLCFSCFFEPCMLHFYSFSHNFVPLMLCFYLLCGMLKICEKRQIIAYFIFFRVSFCHFSCYISELSLMDMVA